MRAPLHRRAGVTQEYSMEAGLRQWTRFQIVLARFATVVILAEGRVAGPSFCRYPRSSRGQRQEDRECSHAQGIQITDLSGRGPGGFEGALPRVFVVPFAL